MKWLLDLWEKFKQWLSQPISRKAIRVTELPDQLSPMLVYIVGEGGYLWYASMVCPCGCKEVLYMNLGPEEQPKWQVTEHTDGNVTLHPSIRRVRGCKSHFFLRKGVVKWC
jgi:hypothetical protein